MNAGTVLRELAGFEGADGIAQFFLAEGVTGMRGHPCECPVAQWLKHKTGVVFHVTPLGVVVNSEVNDPSIDSSWLPIPEEVSAFLDLFDSGLYPQLESTGDLVEDQEDVA